MAECQVTQAGLELLTMYHMVLKMTLKSQSPSLHLPSAGPPWQLLNGLHSILAVDWGCYTCCVPIHSFCRLYLALLFCGIQAWQQLANSLPAHYKGFMGSALSQPPNLACFTSALVTMALEAYKCYF